MQKKQEKTVPVKVCINNAQYPSAISAMKDAPAGYFPEQCPCCQRWRLRRSPQQRKRKPAPRQRQALIRKQKKARKKL